MAGWTCSPSQYWWQSHSDSWHLFCLAAMNRMRIFLSFLEILPVQGLGHSLFPVLLVFVIVVVGLLPLYFKGGDKLGFNGIISSIDPGGLVIMWLCCIWNPAGTLSSLVLDLQDFQVGSALMPLMVVSVSCHFCYNLFWFWSGFNGSLPGAPQPRLIGSPGTACLQRVKYFVYPHTTHSVVLFVCLVGKWPFQSLCATLEKLNFCSSGPAQRSSNVPFCQAFKNSLCSHKVL